jgi:hypothetical protein
MIQQSTYLDNATVSNSTIRSFIAKSHNSWLGAFLENSPMEEFRWRPIRYVEGDQSYIDQHANNPDRVMKDKDGKWQTNILLPFKLLSPTGVAMNSKAAIDDFKIVAGAVKEGKVSLEADISDDVLEVLADKVHQAWIVREDWRRGKDADFDKVDVPYAELPDVEKDKDRSRVRQMFEAIKRDCPRE